MKRILIVTLPLLCVILLTNCKPTQFTVNSVPESTLIISHGGANIDNSYLSTIRGEAPNQFKNAFFGKKDTLYVTAEKRGYEKQTVKLTKTSAPNISFNLKKIEGVSEELTYYDDSTVNKFLIIPIGIEITIHSGIGNLDKYTFSPERSDIVSKDFFKALESESKNNRIEFYKDWKNINENNLLITELKDYLLKLNIARLPYYGYPPKIEDCITSSPQLKEIIEQLKEEPNSYLVFIWGKCISETTGRIIGNVAVSGASAAMYGASMAAGKSTYLYNPAAFMMDSGTRLAYFIVDPDNLEVVKIKSFTYGYDINKEKQLPKLIEKTSNYPDIE